MWITLIVSILIVFVAVLVIWFGNRSGEKSLGLLITNYVGIFLQQSQDHILKINNIAMRWAIQKYLENFLVYAYLYQDSVGCYHSKFTFMEYEIQRCNDFNSNCPY